MICQGDLQNLQSLPRKVQDQEEQENQQEHYSCTNYSTYYRNHSGTFLRGQV